MATLSPTTRRRLDIQGFDGVDDSILADVGPWRRFAFGLCTTIAGIGTALASPAILWSLTPIALLGAVFDKHPFDLLYDYVLRRFTRTMPLPPRGAPTRFACGLATVWLLVTGWCFHSGAAVAGYVLGGLLTSIGALVSTTDVCIPSLVYRSLFGFPPKPDASLASCEPDVRRARDDESRSSHA